MLQFGFCHYVHGLRMDPKKVMNKMWINGIHATHENCEMTLVILLVFLICVMLQSVVIVFVSIVNVI